MLEEDIAEKRVGQHNQKENIKC